MRFTNTILVIALLAFSYTNAFEFASLSEVNEITTSSYGKSLLETISLSLEQKGNVNEVQKLLNDLLFKLNQDQAKDDANWAKENARLKAKIARLTREIEVLRVEILRLLAEKEKYENLRDKAAQNLVQYKAQLANNVEALVVNEKKRAEDSAEFKRSQSEHTDVLNALDAVLKELETLVGSVSGANRPEHVRQGAEEKRDAAFVQKPEHNGEKPPQPMGPGGQQNDDDEDDEEKHDFVQVKQGLQRSFMQISQDEAEVQAFVELATQADQNALRDLIKAILKIKDSTQQSYNDDVVHEKRSVTAYTSLKSLLESDNRKLERMIVEETKNHALYVRRVAELTVKIAQTRKLRDGKIAEKVATIKERLAKKARYEEDKAQRDEERRVIKRIDAIVKRRLANMSKYLNENLA
jgi:hypothetical protein